LAVGPLTDLDAFLTDHDRCGELKAGIEGDVVWFACECGARIVRRVTTTADACPDGRAG
jgi:hypothetical protein